MTYRDKSKNEVALLGLVLFLVAAGCSKGQGSVDADGGGDGDTDTDTDADGDGDTDTDTDADGDGDTDTDGDGDTDTDTDGDTDTDTDGDTDADTDNDTDADTDGDNDTDIDADTDVDTDTDSDGDTDADTDGDGDTDTDGDSDTDTDADTETDEPDTDYPRVSAPFYVDAYPELVPLDDIDAHTACGPTMCFSVYSISSTQTIGTRILTSGEVIDTPRIVLGAFSSSRPVGVAPLGEDFVVLRERIPPDEGELVRIARNYPRTMERIRGADGSSFGAFTTEFECKDSAIFSNGNSILVVCEQYSTDPDTGSLVHYPLLQLFDGDLKPVASQIPIPFDDPYIDVEPYINVTPGEDQYLISGQRHAVRLDSRTGEILDTEPIVYSKYGQIYLTGVYSNGIYQMMGSEEDRMVGVRVRASDGEVLEKDDEFNQISGERLLCEACLDGSDIRLRYKNINNKVVVYWHSPAQSDDEYNRFYAFEVDVDTGERADGTTVRPSASTVQFPLSNGELYFVDSRGILAESDRFLPFTINDDFELTIDEPKAFAFESADRGNPTVVASDSQFLVLFELNGMLLATRIDPDTGVYLDDPPLTLGPKSYYGARAAASHGDTFMVVWAHSAEEIARTLIGSDGSLTQLDPILDENASVEPQYALTHNGTYYFFYWSTSYLNGVRMLPDGTILSEPYLNTNPQGPVVLGELRIPSIDVIGDTTPTEDRKTFLLSYQYEACFTTTDGIDCEWRDTAITRYRSESGSVISPSTHFDIGYSKLLTDGTDAVLTYQDNGGVQAFFIDYVDGEAQSDPVTVLDADAMDASFGGAWYDGLTYNVLLHRDADTYMHRMRTDLTPVSVDVAKLPKRIAKDNYIYHVATTKDGRSMFVCTEEDPIRFGKAIKGQLIENRLQ